MSEVIRYVVDDGLATITLARAEANNAMSQDFIDQLAAASQKAAKDPSVRAVLILAEGKNFCVGGDIKAFASQAEPGDFIEQLATRLHDGMLALATMDAPVIVAVRGAAAGAGFSLAAAADILIAGESANFSLAYTGIGLTSDGGATWTLPRIVGLRRAQELAFLNRRLTAREALDWGLVTRVLPDEIAETEATEIARRIAAGPTRAFGGIKRLLREGFDAALPDHLDAEARAIGEALRTEDAQSAVAAFLARQAPVFSGR